MPDFLSDEWVEAWVALANESVEFKASGRGREGVVTLVIEPDPDAGLQEPVYLLLAGRDGEVVDYEFGTRASAPKDSMFVLRAPYARWKQVVRQELNPIKGLVQGKITVQGHLPVVLRWTGSILALAKLAGQVETEFPDERKAADGA